MQKKIYAVHEDVKPEPVPPEVDIKAPFPVKAEDELPVGEHDEELDEHAEDEHSDEELEDAHSDEAKPAKKAKKVKKKSR